MTYQDQQLNDHENSLTYPDRLWCVVYPDDKQWSNPVTDRYEAEQEYWRAKDSGENVDLAYVWEGRITGKWSENVNEFNYVRL